MSTQVMLIRHGETSWNRQKRYQGHQDININKTGKNQAQKLAVCLIDKDIDKIYASDLKRAYNTARIINKKHELEIKQKSNLRELNFGSWEGKTYQQIKSQDPKILKRWNKDPVHNQPPGGENLQTFKIRIKKSFNKIIKENERKKILIVTHGGVIKVFLTIILNMSLKNYWQFNIESTAVNIINFYGNKAIINLLNDQSHLKI